VPLYKNDDDFRVFYGMMDGLACLPVPDLTNGIHPLRTLFPDDPPEAAELLDYFDSLILVPALAHVVGSGITVDSGIMYVPNGWWKHRWTTC
jgi:hypothetical protein